MGGGDERKGGDKSAKIFFLLHGLSINTPFAFIQYKSSACPRKKGGMWAKMGA